MQKIQQQTGAAYLLNAKNKIVITILCFILAGVFAKFGLIGGLMMVGSPFAFFGAVLLIKKPEWGIAGSFIIGFLACGLVRYIDAPLGLLIDVFLIISWIALLFRKDKNKWKPLKNDLMYLSLFWYAYVVFELINPEMVSAMAWFYAMRGMGFYQILTFGLVFILFRHPKYLDYFLKTVVVFSVIGTIWGLKQMFLGTDAAENAWLNAGMNGQTHILHGVLRVFSFYSDAGQFGASQAMVALICGIMVISPINHKERAFYGIGFLFTFIGFAVSGTRGALAVPAIGAIVFLLVSRNFKLLALGILVIISTFILLKYTFVLQHVEQVRRMRTALDPNDASLQVRLQNQVTFGKYLKSRPFGGGIGSAGYWGHRFSPHTLLANTATDSYYVKAWAETGLVGMCLHLFFFGYVLGKGGAIAWNIRDPILKAKITSLLAALSGILMASYGNQVFSQMPTGIILYIAIPFIFLAPHFDQFYDHKRSNQKQLISPTF